MLAEQWNKRKGFRYCSTPPPDPRNANATGGKPMAFKVGAGIRESANSTNVPIESNNTQRGATWHQN